MGRGGNRLLPWKKRMAVVIIDFFHGRNEGSWRQVISSAAEMTRQDGNSSLLRKKCMAVTIIDFFRG